MSGIIDRLERKSLIARLSKFGDKRVVNIVLTTAGGQFINNILYVLHERLSEKLQKLSSIPMNKIF